MSLNPRSSLKRNPLYPVLYVALAFMISAGAAADHSLNTGDGDLLLHGFDPVAYFISGQARQGSENHAASYEGARFLFVSAANKDRFIASPAQFVPQFGGFCAYGVRHGKKFDINPEAWEIVDGKLYVMLDRSTHALWKQQASMNIAVANRTWQVIRDVPASALE